MQQRRTLMKSWKYKFLEKSILGQDIDTNDVDMIISKCINRAYRDMITAGRFYIKSNNDICINLKNILEKHNYQFSNNLILESTELFGDNKIIINGNRDVTGFGLAQKIINMAFKYFYIFDDYINKSINYTICDCPLDSIILNKINSHLIWCKCTETQYVDCQKMIKDKLNRITLDDELLHIGNLAFDFLSW